VEQPEVEKLVGELELGVDRLRSLYEQYFMGIEKLEPSVPRKDVDRRIHILRKEQIRNTALRFRFQMILQRYNTYQTHWQRICREIENGTYKRHVLRANRRFDNDRRSSAPPVRRSSIPPKPAVAAAAAGIPSPLPPPAPLGFPQPGASLPVDLAAELADLEHEFGPVIPAGPIRPLASPAKGVPFAPKPIPAKAGVPQAATPPGAAAKPPAVAPRPAPPPLGAASPRPPALPPQIVSRAPVPTAPTAGPALARSPAAPQGAPRAPAPLGVPVAPAAAVRAPAPAPQASAPKPTPVAAAAPVAVKPPAHSDQGLPEHRVRALYEQYVDAKRRQKESTATITYDAVAKSLRDSSAKLREKHGKSVDFEVTIRDGKAILKPVIK
jgi:hypothetical protein